ncbi:hypothetical protein AYX14_04825 [Cryptococcus neoformans]|nr:hypothetical protein AYX15_01395 [Cryptococcus neoformans var. grubii]OWZ69776.1 hypothetical protein AYX14_04825 [Cryptococcus neoformans var. grubii]OXG17850.1 hypothetical protein C366_03252 [Cryptococcus neoformans var. grubii Tu401-1]OXM79715.1 hypothetical protein C364_03220 [Cryptococcus neoformans var. grubii Bt63]
MREEQPKPLVSCWSKRISRRTVIHVSLRRPNHIYVISSSVFNPDTNKVERAFFTSLAPTHPSVTDNERSRRISIANELSCKITEGLKQSSEQWLPSCVKDGSTFELQKKEREIYNLLSKDDPYKETGLTFYPYVDMAESIPWDPLEVC